MTQETEFERVCNGEKPMAAYCKVSPGPWYNKNRDDFEILVANGKLKKVKFNIKNDNQNFSIIYESYSNEDNIWRMEVYRLIKKIGQTRWNADLEAIEGILLGYRGMYSPSEEQP